MIDRHSSRRLQGAKDVSIRHNYHVHLTLLDVKMRDDVSIHRVIDRLSSRKERFIIIVTCLLDVANDRTMHAFFLK